MTRFWSLTMPALVLVLSLLVAAAPAAAQEATPAPQVFAEELGLPELRVTVTDEAFAGLPAEVPAGRYLLTLDIRASQGGGLGFMRLPEGMAFADFEALLADPPAASPEAPIGTPVAAVGPPEEGGDEGPPEWYYETRMAGGTGGFAGQTVQAVVDLTPGEWVAWADDPASPQPPVPLTVTAGLGATPAPGEPEPDVTVRMFEYGFELAGELAPGRQVLEVANVGAQPHHLFMVRTPGPITEEQVARILELEAQGATPAPGSDLPDPDEFLPVAYVSTLSSGETARVPVALEPGHYVVVCFVPDIASGMPHAFEGMYEVVEVGDV